MHLIVEPLLLGLPRLLELLLGSTKFTLETDFTVDTLLLLGLGATLGPSD